MYTPSAQGRITLNQHFVVISRRSYHLRALTSRPALAEQARKSKSEQGLRQDSIRAAASSFSLAWWNGLKQILWWCLDHAKQLGRCRMRQNGSDRDLLEPCTYSAVFLSMSWDKGDRVFWSKWGIHRTKTQEHYIKFEPQYSDTSRMCRWPFILEFDATSFNFHERSLWTG
jgi:hypothetical protein